MVLVIERICAYGFVIWMLPSVTNGECTPKDLNMRVDRYFKVSTRASISEERCTILAWYGQSLRSKEFWLSICWPMMFPDRWIPKVKRVSEWMRTILLYPRDNYICSWIVSSFFGGYPKTRRGCYGRVYHPWSIMPLMKRDQDVTDTSCIWTAKL